TAVNSNHHLAETAGVFKSVQYVSTKTESDARMNTVNSQDISILSVDELEKIKENKNLVFFFVDTTNPQKKDATIASLKAVQKLLSGTKDSRCVVTVLLPKIEVFPGEVTSLSERELNFFMEKVCEKTPESEYYFEIEKMCRGFVRDHHSNITLLRFDNVFAPDCFHTPSFDLQKIVSDCVKSGKIVITDDDETLVTTATYIRNACCAIFAAAFTGLTGHVYNVAYNTITVSDIKRCIFNGYKDQFSLSVKLSGKVTRQYNALNSLVFKKLRMKRVMSFRSAMNYAVAFLADYDCPNILAKMHALAMDEEQ
ncbi:MAG: hypothetical protein IJT66_07245, partial [Clostridia bacterium]|nr:hypothetical protein [Clostridia bacterium]